MRVPFRHLALSALFIGTGLTGTLQAQSGQRPPRDSASRPGAPQPGMRREIIEERVVRGRGPEGGPPRAQRGNPAAMLLGLRSRLELSDDQIKRLEALRDAQTPKVNAADMLRARADLLEATQGDGNLTAARAALDKMSRLRTDQMLVGLKARQDARAVLTPTQKTKLDGMRQRMAGRARQAMRQGAMARGAMRRGAKRRGGVGPGAWGPRGGGERVIEERIIRGPGAMGPDGPQGPMMPRRGGHPPVPPQTPFTPDSAR